MRSLFLVGPPTPSSIEAALHAAADGLLIDLEDSALPDREAEYPEGAVQALPALVSTTETVLVRINDVMSETGRTDLVRLVEAGIANILLANVRTAQEFHQADAIIGRTEAVVRRVGVTRLWATVETPECVLNLKEIGTAPRIAGFVFGAGHLCEEPGALQGGRGASWPVCGKPDELLHHKQLIVLTARANGLQAIDSGYPRVDDPDGTHSAALMSAKLDFDGIMAYAPDQVHSIHRAFTPTLNTTRPFAASTRSLTPTSGARPRQWSTGGTSAVRARGPHAASSTASKGTAETIRRRRPAASLAWPEHIAQIGQIFLGDRLPDGVAPDDRHVQRDHVGGRGQIPGPGEMQTHRRQEVCQQLEVRYPRPELVAALLETS
jgi:citrate lyase subunit beta/citryl-CoA lyase